MSKPSKEASGLGHVDQIREIIVGDHFRHFEARITALEGTFTEQLASLQKRQEARERSLSKQVEKLQERLKTERTERLAETRKSAADLGGVVKQLDCSKVDRSDLADLLEGLTARIRKNGRS